MQIPKKIPEKGFYYHYKHDPKGLVGNYAYEMVGVGCHTEDDCRPEDAHMVVYRPLYDSLVYRAGKLYDLRPLTMWMGTLTKNNKTFPRFTKITDKKVLIALEKIKKEMYGEN